MLPSEESCFFSLGNNPLSATLAFPHSLGRTETVDDQAECGQGQPLVGGAQFAL
jgi:hypothetical protein